MLHWRPPAIDDRTFWDHVREEDGFTHWREVVNQAHAQVPASPLTPGATDFLAARRSNDRARVDQHWGDRSRLSALAGRRAMLGFQSPDEYGQPFDGQDDQLTDWLWALLTQPTWVASAHLPKQELPDLSQPPVLDLSACEMALAMAEIAEIFKPWLCAHTPHFYQSVQHEALQRVIRPFGDPDRPNQHPSGWSDPQRVHNNWTGVCAGSILGACQSLLEQGLHDPVLANARDRSIELLNVYLDKGFTPSGECDEGPGYWAYGLSFACRGWMRLSEEQLRQRVDLDRLKVVAEYPRRAYLFDQSFYGRGDCGNIRPGLDWVWWLAGATQSDWLAAWCQRDGKMSLVKGLVPWRDAIAIMRMKTTDADSRALDAASAIQPDQPVGARRWFADQQAMIYETRSHNHSLVVTLAGGHNAMCHNHNDVGDVNLWVDRQPVLIDMGAPRYLSDFFGPKRYDYTTAGSQGHNLPSIAGHTQQPGREAAAVIVHRDDRAYELDATAAYASASALQRWTRRLEIHDDENAPLRLIDRFMFHEPAPVTLRFWTGIEPRVKDKAVHLGDVHMTFSPAPDAVTVQPHHGSDLHLRDQAAQRTLYCIELSFPASSQREIVTDVRA